MKIVGYLVVGLALPMLLPYASAAELSAAQKREIIFECQQLVTDYAYYRDLRDADKFAELFTEGARMQARGHWNEGRQALRDHVNSEDESAPVLLDNFVVVGKYHDTFVLTDDG